MPHCTNCGSSVKDEWHYCGGCGESLTPADENDGNPPPIENSPGDTGFLSLKSKEYIVDIGDGDAELDEKHPGYAHLMRDVAAGFRDFGYVSLLDDLSLLEVLAEGRQGAGIPDAPISELSREDRKDYLMLIGWSQLPRLYDQTFGFTWQEEFGEWQDEAVEKIEEYKKKQRGDD